MARTRVPAYIEGVVLRRSLSVLAVLSLVGVIGAAEPPTRATRVHVKKSKRTMELFAGDHLIGTYSVAVGRGGPGNKKMEGDNVTPVGRYHVVKRVPSHLRIFMEIDYPNAEDKLRFEDAKKRGDLPKTAKIGGDIGIHGEPPEAKPFKKAEYLSHGCVVLEDAEIDKVARIVPDGAIVDIED